MTRSATLNTAQKLESDLKIIIESDNDKEFSSFIDDNNINLETFRFTNSESSIFIHCSYSNSVKIIEYLLQNCENKNNLLSQSTKDGNTAFLWASWRR